MATFPLTRLPAFSVKNVLQMMSPLQLVVFSLLSKKCKDQVNSLNTSAETMRIQVTNSIVIEIPFEEGTLRIGFFELEPHMVRLMRDERNKTLRAAAKVTAGIYRNGVYRENCQWFTNKLGVKECVEHLKFVFPNLSVDLIDFSVRAYRFSLDSIQETFPNIPQHHTGDYGFNRLILEKFLPTYSISIARNCFEDFRIPHKTIFAMSNVPNLWIEGPITNITVNDLLINSSNRIDDQNSRISSKEFNRFLHLWIKGANPRLESMTIFKADRHHMDIALKGIKHQIMPRTLERVFKYSDNSQYVVAGVDIHRKDGTKATIGLSRSEGRSRFLMCVWYGHCIG
ncbi:unnamed protein product [Caenorhabditis brenneri]